MKDKTIGTLAVISSVFICGLNFISMKYLLMIMPLFGLISLRFIIASVFLSIIIAGRIIRRIEYKKIEGKDIKAIILTGFLGVTLYYYFQTTSMLYLSVSLAALICSTIPIFTLIIESIIHRKKIQSFIYLSFSISLLGVYLVLDKSLGELFFSGEALGILFMLLAIFSWIAYTFSTFNLQKKYDSIYLLNYQCIVGSMFLLAFAINDIHQIIKVFQEAENLYLLVFNLLFVGIIGSALGYFFYIYGMNKLGVEISSLYMNLIPVVTAVASFIIFGEYLNIKQLIGIGIVLSSIYFVTYQDYATSKKGYRIQKDKSM